MLDKNRILLAMASSGGGHRSAAQALHYAFKNTSKIGNVTVDVVDFFRDGALPVSLFPLLYGEITRISDFAWGLVWDSTNGLLRTRFGLKLLSILNLKRTVDLIDQIRPTCIVSVHPIVTHMVREALLTMDLSIPLYVVVTDMVNIHPAWASKGIKHYFVPTEDASARLVRYGIPMETITTLGVPVHPKFIFDGDKRTQCRISLGIHESLFTVLIVGGGEGTGKIYDHFRVLSESGLDIQLVVICGNNSKLQKRLANIESQVPARIEGYVTNMHEYMHAADLIVTRAGPGIVNEALAAKLPIVLTGFLPGQEEGIPEFLESHGLGIYEPSPEQLPTIVARFINKQEFDKRSLARSVDVQNSQSALLISEQISRDIEITKRDMVTKK